MDGWIDRQFGVLGSTPAMFLSGIGWLDKTSYGTIKARLSNTRMIFYEKNSLAKSSIKVEKAQGMDKKLESATTNPHIQTITKQHHSEASTDQTMHMFGD